jgi:tetratricopeptide (TPR) repeat protein
MTQAKETEQTELQPSKRSRAPWLLARVSGALMVGCPLVFVACANGADDALTPEEEVEYVESIDHGRELLAKGDAREGLAALQRSEDLKPNSFAVHNNLCVAYGMLGQRADAVASCERALEIDPNSEIGRNNLKWVSSLPPAVAAAPVPAAAPAAK